MFDAPAAAGVPPLVLLAGVGLSRPLLIILPIIATSSAASSNMSSSMPSSDS